MNAAVLMQSCPSEEVLAAFVDQRLDAKSRLEVIAHLADCGECRDLVVAASDSGVADGAEAGTVTRGRFGWRVLAPLASAAAIVVVFGVTPVRERLLGRSGMSQLVEAANGLPERTTEARLSGDFAHRKHTRLRGEGADPGREVLTVEREMSEVAVLTAAARIEERAQEKPTAANLHASGVAHILTKSRDAAVRDLERAVDAGAPSAELLNDLAAAYLTRGHQEDLAKALDTARRAWAMEQTPAAAWNIALALDYQQRDGEAIAAWQKYLELDPSSGWAQEARERLDRLRDAR